MEAGQIIWMSGGAEPAAEDQTLFLLDPELGLMDIDFHLITGAGWSEMKASGADSTAMLYVAPRTTMETVAGALKELVEKGHYKKVEIDIREP